MRLLELKSNGELTLTKNLINNIPSYAILSHTWGEDDEEVTFRDLAERSGESKAGYRKIQFCGEQAARDNLRYFWVDTCCIDKSNNTELSEAINSMFRWYRDATRCYVYLADVSTNGHDHLDASSRLWEPDHRGADGLPVAGHFKSLLPRRQLSSSPWRASHSVIRSRRSVKFMRPRELRSRRFKEMLYLNSVSLSECHRQKLVRLREKKIRLILYWAFSTSACRPSTVRG
jgi:hypothetical protein